MLDELVHYDVVDPFGLFLLWPGFTNLPSKTKSESVRLSFNCLHLFESQDFFVLEVEPSASQSESSLWFLIDKTSCGVTQLILLAFNYSDLKEERFFKQGYLSFDDRQAIYIRESSSLQVVLETRETDQVPQPVRLALQVWLADTGKL